MALNDQFYRRLLLATKITKIHKMFEHPVIRSGTSEDRNAGHRSFNVFEVCSVRADECDSSLNCWQPHVVQDNVPSHGAQLCAQSELGQHKIEEMASIHKDDVKILGVVGKMGECSKGSLFDEPEPFSAEAPPLR